MKEELFDPMTMENKKKFYVKSEHHCEQGIHQDYKAMAHLGMRPCLLPAALAHCLPRDLATAYNKRHHPVTH